MARRLLEDLLATGLTEYEARVYIALLEARSAKAAGFIAKAAGIPRNRVYDVFGSLHERGLVEVQVSGIGRLYRPLPFTTYYDSRLEAMRESVAEAEARRHDLMEALAPRTKEETEVPDAPTTCVLSGRRAVARAIDDAISRAGERIVFAAGHASLPRVWGHLAYAKDEGATLPTAHVYVPDDAHVQSPMDVGDVQVRQIRGAIRSFMVLVDAREAILVTSSPEDGRLRQGQDSGRHIVDALLVRDHESLLASASFTPRVYTLHEGGISA